MLRILLVSLLALALLPTSVPTAEYKWVSTPPGKSLFRDGVPVAVWNESSGVLVTAIGTYQYDGSYDFSDSILSKPSKVDFSTDALHEVNAERSKRGLYLYKNDPDLAAAALQCAKLRASRLMFGHTSNDFSALSAGVSARASGCAAWDGNDWGACCTYDTQYTYCGAAWVRGSDGKRYMHLFVR